MGILSGLLGGDTSGFDSALRNNERNRKLYEDIKLPEYENYVPEEYQYETIKEDPNLRSMQMSALQKMSGLADNGLAAEDEANFTKASQNAHQIAKSGTDAAIANANARGVGGSGMEFAMREMANQKGAENAQNAGLEQAATTARQRALNNMAYNTAVGNQRSQDFQANSANTGIVNRFKEANTNNRNSAFQYNQGLQDRTYSNQMGRANAMAGINNNESQIQLARGEYDNKRKNSVLDGVEGIGMTYATGGFDGNKKKTSY
jgi:hypothetical protein